MLYEQNCSLNNVELNVLNYVYPYGKLIPLLKEDGYVSTDSLGTLLKYEKIKKGELNEIIFREQIHTKLNTIEDVVVFLWNGKETGLVHGLVLLIPDIKSFYYALNKCSEKADNF